MSTHSRNILVSYSVLLLILNCKLVSDCSPIKNDNIKDEIGEYSPKNGQVYDKHMGPNTYMNEPKLYAYYE